MFHAHLLHTLDLFGTTTFAASGALIAHEQRKNGAYAILYALLTALGGGTLRDILLSQQPVFWMRSPTYLWLSGTVGLVVFALAQFTRLHREQFWFADAASLAIFTIVGAQVAMQSIPFSEFSPFHWILPPFMGLLTAIGGGLVRDLIDRQTPHVLEHPIYAMTSLVGGIVYGALVSLQIPALWAIGSAIAVVFLLLPIPAEVILDFLPGHLSRHVLD